MTRNRRENIVSEKHKNKTKKTAENPSWHWNKGTATARNVQHRGGLPEENWIVMDLIVERWQCERKWQ